MTDRFAAMTSAVGDAMIMRACLGLLKADNGTFAENGLHAATWLAMKQELQYDDQAQRTQWYKYNADLDLNPVVLNKSRRSSKGSEPTSTFPSLSVSTSKYPIQFIPQFVWVAILLDVVVVWNGDGSSPNSTMPGASSAVTKARILEMRALGERLWKEAAGMVHESRALLQRLEGCTGNGNGGGRLDALALAEEARSRVMPKQPAPPSLQRNHLRLEDLLDLYGNATADMKETPKHSTPHIRASTVLEFRVLLKKLGLV
jgi:hypothetical protein